LETALDAVVVMRDDGIVADWNDQAVNVFGWTREEAVGHAMADLIIPERYRKAHKNGLERYLSSGQATVLGRRIEVSAIRKNGEEFPVELSIAPINGGRLLFVGFLRDMTEHNALRQAQSEVARMSQRMAMGEMGHRPRDQSAAGRDSRRMPTPASAGCRASAPTLRRRAPHSNASSATAIAPVRSSTKSA